MGANIAVLRYCYGVSFDGRLHIINEQSNCEIYTFHSVSEQCATIGVLR